MDARLCAGVSGIALPLSLAGPPARVSAATFARQQPDAASVLVSGESGRPLQEVVDALRQRHGWLVSYEDPPFEADQDLVDVTAAVRRDGHLERKVFVPRGGPFTFIYDLRAAVAEGPVSILRALTDDYALTDNPGTFDVRATPPLFHVVPTSVRGRDGRVRPITSILDTRVTLIEGRRSVATLLDEVTGDVSRQIGVRVSVGVVADNLLLQTFVQSAAVNESARQVITRALATVNRPATWDLRYAPRVGVYMMGVVYLSR